MDSLNLTLGVVGCLIYSTALHFKQPDKKIEYGGFWGIAQNLTGIGRAYFTVGFLLAMLSLIVSPLGRAGGIYSSVSNPRWRGSLE